MKSELGADGHKRFVSDEKKVGGMGGTGQIFSPIIPILPIHPRATPHKLAVFILKT